MSILTGHWLLDWTSMSRVWGKLYVSLSLSLFFFFFCLNYGLLLVLVTWHLWFLDYIWELFSFGSISGLAQNYSFYFLFQYTPSSFL